MFPVSPIFVAIYLAAYALAGMVIGVITGWMVSLTTRCGSQGLLKDTFLGSFGYLGLGSSAAYSCRGPETP
jgi:hypothetical protein